MGIRDRLAAFTRRLLGKSAGNRWWANVLPAWRAGQPADWAEDVEEQVRHYRHWVYAAVRAIASKVAGTELTLCARRADGVDEVTDLAHPLVRLLEEVNPFETRHGLWERTVTFLELTGNAYWYVAENRLGVPAEIWLIPSQMMRVVPDRQRFIKGYVCRVEGSEVGFDRRDIIHLKYPNPRSLYYGRGPLQAAAASVDAVVALCADVGIVCRMRELSIPEDGIDEMAEAAMRVTRLLGNNPRGIRIDDVRRIYREAY